MLSAFFCIEFYFLLFIDFFRDSYLKSQVVITGSRIGRLVFISGVWMKIHSLPPYEGRSNGQSRFPN